MAVDYKGQPLTNQTAFSTTGIMNKKPAKLKPLKMPTQKAVAERVTPDRVEQPKVKVFGQDMFPEFGIGENTVSIPRSIILERFGSMSNFRQMVQRDGNNNNVPPSQGIMTSPQTT